MKLQKYFLIIFTLLSVNLFAQITEQTQRYREDAKGNFQFRREGVMDGNLARTLFYNTGEVAYWGFQPSGEWPKGTGQSYLDGVSVLIGAGVNSKNGLVHPIEAYYREEMDKDPITGEIWGLSPVPGYLNSSYARPAINKDKKSWPANWPAALGLTPEWDGFWYGYFGRGVMNSDFETFFVMDDNRDGEFRRNPYNYYPMQADTTWGGLGIRVEVRGFQWSHVLAEDIIFWHYDIVNISDYDLDEACFGFYSDPGVGGPDDNGDNVYYDRKLDLTYAWDSDNRGTPGNWTTGYYGYAYLESPGNALNGIDDDQDNMTDERRDDNIDNDGDWIRYVDLNGNGVWDAAENEPLNNDVGKDGVGPFDQGYTLPDEGEGDGQPTDGEPNFDKTDKDESDQLGLMAVSLTILSDKGPTGIWPKNDEVMWATMTGGFKDTSISNSNVSMVFSSGPFPLKKNLRERFSMALAFGSNLEDLVFNKETVQQIYNANYNFSKPPITPTLTAVPGDKKVFLYWNSISEESRDPFLGYENDDPTQGYKKDFEGYMIYRSSEAEFNDIKLVTDSKGEAKYWKPIAQFDMVDSMQLDGVWQQIAGPDPVGINGAHFWRGSNSGLQHSYVDNDVLNGQRYYYALVAYDQGDPSYGTSGLQPAECTKVITEDYAGNIQFIDINCAVVVPNAPVAGYVPPAVTGDVDHVTSGIGSGNIQVNVLNPSEIKDGASYKVEFSSSNLNLLQYSTNGYNLTRTYQGETTVIETNTDSTKLGPDQPSFPFDGLNFVVLNDSINVVDSLTGWVTGDANYRLDVAADVTSRGMATPYDYEIEFFDEFVDTSAFQPKKPVKFKIINTSRGEQVDLQFNDVDFNDELSMGDVITIVEYYKDPKGIANAKWAWNITYNLPRNPNVTPSEPNAGDKYRISTSKPFKQGDYFVFGAQPQIISTDMAKEQLGNISVVPNPYVSTAKWERRTLNFTGRGDRKIDFINLPAQCTVRIYTVSGALVKTLEKDSGMNDGSVSWNLVSEDGMDIAYGIYIYHVDAPGIGEHIGKFAVIK